MTSEKVNFSTGPVEIQKPVLEALGAVPISHRSREFEKVYHATVETLCESFNVKQTYILQGSGTLANEVMIWQIKLTQSKGIVLSNGEFGERLIDQCLRNSLDFISIKKQWGYEIDLLEIQSVIESNNIEWLLFCHCETSTGIINSLESLNTLSKRYGCMCYVDCMSTIGTNFIDLSEVAMASGSSGKGLCSVSGLAVVFSNIKVISDSMIPTYFDLDLYSKKNGLPFTLSSNLLFALKASIDACLEKRRWSETDIFSEMIFNTLSSYQVIPYANKKSRVFTIILDNIESEKLGEYLKMQNLILSYQSSYLIKKNWIQMALFGCYNETQIKYAVDLLNMSLNQYCQFNINEKKLMNSPA